MLKVGFPHRETEHAAEALACWDGDGAVRLLAADRSRGALLVERCRPGTALSALGPEAALDALVDLLPRLWRPVAPDAPFTTVADEAAHWAAGMPERWARAGRPYGAELLALGLELLAELPAGQGEQVLVHQDLHGGNVLAAERQPWLAIDPKPLVAEREFALAPVVRSHELGPGRAHLRRRLHRLVSAFGLDGHRTVAWTLAQTLAWNASGGGRPEHLAVVEWLRALL